MSSMAKIFVVVNLVLGVAAFGSAATLLGAQDDYKRAFEEANEKFQQYKQNQDGLLTGLRANLADQTGEARNAIARANNAEANEQATKKELADAKSTNETLNSTANTLTKEVSSLREMLEKDRANRQRLADESKQANAALANMTTKFENEARNRAALEQQIDGMTEEASAAAARNGDLEKQLRAANFELDRYRQRHGPLIRAGQGADGKVSAVRESLVTISVGSEDGVRNGDVYHISRGEDYCGQMRITSVFKGMATGEFDSRHMGSGGMPQVGDIAYVRK